MFTSCRRSGQSAQQAAQPNGHAVVQLLAPTRSYLVQSRHLQVLRVHQDQDKSTVQEAASYAHHTSPHYLVRHDDATGDDHMNPLDIEGSEGPVGVADSETSESLREISVSVVVVVDLGVVKEGSKVVQAGWKNWANGET